MKKPNILLFLIDDMGWKDLSCYDSGFYETPNIDKLAKDGVRFTDGYATCPVCSPSRASLLTGRYPARIGVTDWIGSKTSGKLIEPPYLHELPHEEYNLAKALKDAGYETWHVGKWHLGGEAFYPQHQGFDVNIGGNSHGMPYKGYFSPWHLPNLKDGEDGEYLTDRLTDEAMKLIDSYAEAENKDSQKPFFLNFWHYAVHTPIQSPKKLVDKYKIKAEKMQLDKVNPYVEGENFPSDQKRHLKVVRRMIQSDPSYAAMIENLDQNIGRVINKLKEKGLYEDTVILFLSDNGGLATAEGSPTCNLPLSEGKGWAYEGGLRVPFIISYPKAFSKNLVSDQVVTLADAYPTLLSLAGSKPPEGITLDGIDITKALKGQPMPERPVFWHYPHYGNQGGVPSAMVRYGAYKLIEEYENDTVSLYKLDSDISERWEISDTEPEVTDKLLKLLHDWQKDAKAKMPIKKQS